MKGWKFILGLIVAAALAAVLIFAYRKMSKEREAERQREKPIAAETKISRGKEGEIIVTLDAEAQKRIALAVSPVTATNLNEEIKGFGRVLSPALLVETLSEITSTEVAAKNSREEFTRLKSLADSASLKSLQAAEATSRRDELTVELARNKLLGNWGAAIAQRKDLPEFARALLSREKTLVRVDLPPGENFPNTPKTARIAPLGSAKFLAAEFLEFAPNIESSLQGQSFLFLIEEKNSSLAPGAAVIAYLPLGKKSISGAIIPRDAVLRHQGKTWIYAQTSETTFARREVELKQSLADGWFIPNFDPALRVVTVGAQTLLSEEMKSQYQVPD